MKKDIKKIVISQENLTNAYRNLKKETEKEKLQEIHNRVLRTTELKKQYREVVENYTREFCDRFDFDYADTMDCWIGGDYNMTEVGDMYISFENIREIIDNDIPYETWEAWYYYTLRLHSISTGIPVPNLINYWSGCPLRSEEEIITLERSKENVRIAQERFEQLLLDETPF